MLASALACAAPHLVVGRMEVKPSLSPVRRLVQILDDAPHIHEREERVRDDITGHIAHLNRPALSACRHEPRG